MRRSGWGLFALLVIAGGCRIGTMSPEEFERAYPVGTLTTLGSPGRDDSLAALREAVGGSPVRITSLTFSEHGTRIVAQSPRAPAELDSYAYWEGDVTTRPIPMRGDDEARMAQQLFELDSVPFELLPRLARDAVTTLAIDGSHASYVTVGRSSTRGQLEIEVAVESPRRKGRVIYDRTGAVVTVHRD